MEVYAYLALVKGEKLKCQNHYWGTIVWCMLHRKLFPTCYVTILQTHGGLKTKTKIRWIDYGSVCISSIEVKREKLRCENH